MSKVRKYEESYVQFGFTFTTSKDGVQNPQCFLCGAVFCNDNMRPCKLKMHFQKSHSENAKDSIDVLKQKKARFHKSGTLPTLGFAKPDKPLLLASFKVSYLIAKNKKAHSIGETLVKPCALEMVELVLGKKERKVIEQIPLSNNIVHDRIGDMSVDILQQVLSELKESSYQFSLQLDETTDVASYSQLLAFVRYIHNNDIKEEFLFCEPLIATTKALDVFKLVKDFFESHEIDWKNKLNSICTDGAPSMLGNKSGLGALVKAEAPHVKITHCILHRHALASKTLPSKLKLVMNDAVHIINFIRSRALNHRLFKLFCQEVGADFDVLLYHTEVRWLSRGRVLCRLVDLQTEVSMFLTENDSNFSATFDNPEFSLYLSYLADIFSHLNELNVSLQGRDITIMDAHEKLDGFLNKLPLYKRRIETGNLANFPYLEKALSIDNAPTQPCVPSALKEEICSHLSVLQQSFENYFNMEESKKEIWVRNPFLISLDRVSDDDTAKEELIDLRTKDLIKSEFGIKSLPEFWCSLKDSFPVLCRRAMIALIPFSTTYLCEQGFSTLLNIKTKSRNRLVASHDMRVALSKTVPRFQLLCDKNQQHPSHSHH